MLNRAAVFGFIISLSSMEMVAMWSQIVLLNNCCMFVFLPLLLISLNYSLIWLLWIFFYLGEYVKFLPIFRSTQFKYALLKAWIQFNSISNFLALYHKGYLNLVGRLRIWTSSLPSDTSSILPPSLNNCRFRFPRNNFNQIYIYKYINIYCTN